MKKFICTICGYVYEGDAAPEKCPVCGAPAAKFNEQSGELVWADEHRIGVAQGVDERVLEGLRANFTGEVGSQPCRSVSQGVGLASCLP